jgi:hypothetical protein
MIHEENEMKKAAVNRAKKRDLPVRVIG